MAPKKSALAGKKSSSEPWVRRTRQRISKDGKERAIQPLEFIESLKSSLCRVSAYVNRTNPASFAKPSDLALDDDKLFAKMEGAPFSKGMFANFITTSLEPDQGLLEYDTASNFFYGSLNVEKATGVSLKRVNWTVTESFLDNGYDGLHEPEYTPEEINPAKIPLPTLLQKCCSNYFVRNLWHNYVHTVYHGLNQSNYRDYSGTSRHAMDFEADNWSNILLAESYGNKISASSVTDGEINQDTIRLLRQNKCNSLFSLRATLRGETDRFAPDDLEHLDESEWRFRRTIAGYVSGWLVVSGAAAAQVSVHHRGMLSSNNGRPNRATDGVVVSVNGVQIHITGTAGQRDYQDTKRLLKSIGTRVETAYKQALRRDADLKAFAVASLDAMRKRLAP
jgi:hypothetical protein